MQLYKRLVGIERDWGAKAKALEIKDKAKQAGKKKKARNNFTRLTNWNETYNIKQYTLQKFTIRLNC